MNENNTTAALTDEQILALAQENELDTPDRILSFARALLASPRAAVPEGWKLAPIEPTCQMMVKGGFSFCGRVPNEEVFPEVRKVWERLLNAAPAAPVADQIAHDRNMVTAQAPAAPVAEAACATCATCNGNGMIGGPSYYAPDEGGVPCPDCAQVPAAPVADQIAHDRNMVTAQAVAADGATTENCALPDSVIRKIANQYCEYDELSRTYNILRYEFEEDFFSCVREIITERAAVSPATADERAAFGDIAVSLGMHDLTRMGDEYLRDPVNICWLTFQAACAWMRSRASQAAAPAEAREPSPTAGMTLVERIKHVGGRENAATYIEFGSVAAVDALIKQVIRDLPRPAPADAGEVVESAPTEAMIDAVRPLFLALECGATSIEAVRLHLINSGVNVAVLPKWFSRKGGHLTKAGRAIIAWHLMQGAQGGKGGEA